MQAPEGPQPEVSEFLMEHLRDTPIVTEKLSGQQWRLQWQGNVNKGPHRAPSAIRGQSELIYKAAIK